MSNYSTAAEPSANITINGKNRVKQSEDGKVYLDDNQEFGIELFNPTQDVLLAKIKINGKFISHAGLILKPAERVFLDRYIDTTDKFKFSVYKVEAGNSEVEQAIANNGVVEVYWYKENDFNTSNISTFVTTSSWPNDWNRITWQNNNVLNECSTMLKTDANVINSICENISTSLCAGNNLALNAKSITIEPQSLCASLSLDPKNSNCWSYSSSTSSTTANGATITTSSVEEYKNGECIQNDKKTFYDTGRVEKGGKSNQKLVENNDYIFNSYNSYTNRIHIMPISVKPVTQKELSDRKLYCPNCGKKLHRKYKFCPNCGNKI